MSRFHLINQYDSSMILETDNKKEVIKKLKDLELKDYHDYLDYCQRCIDNYEDPTIDERPGDYYTTYYIEDTKTDKLYDITDYIVLERVD